MKPLRILDLDNCIADDEWRLPTIIDDVENHVFKYHVYHQLAPFDECKNQHLFSNHKDYRYAISTNRPKMLEFATREWLNRSGVKYDLLLMRGGDDERPAVEYKKSNLEYILKNFDIADIDYAYDDNQDIVNMYRVAGINSLKVAINER